MTTPTVWILVCVCVAQISLTSLAVCQSMQNHKAINLSLLLGCHFHESISIHKHRQRDTYTHICIYCMYVRLYVCMYVLYLLIVFDVIL